MKKLFLLLFLLFCTNAHAVNEMWSSTQQTNLIAAKDGSYPEYTHVKSRVDAFSCSSISWSWMHGYPEAMIYKATSDENYCALSRHRASDCRYDSSLSQGNAQNKMRECFVGAALAYSICGDVVSTEDRQGWESRLDSIVNKSAESNWLRPGDSDQVIGIYFGTVVYHLARYGNLNNVPSFADFPSGGLGGFDVTAGQSSNYSIRNRVDFYIRNFTDGEWFEGRSYNYNTFPYALMGYHAINSYLGSDKFPEITSQLSNLGSYFKNKFNQAATDVYTWGDTQVTRGVYQARGQKMATLAAFLSGDSEAWWAYNRMKNTSACIDLNYLGYFDPSASDASSSTPMTGMTWMNDTKNGIFLWHNGWTSNDSFLASHVRNTFRDDHNSGGFHNWDFNYKNRWIVTSRKGYYGHWLDNSPNKSEALVYGGFAQMREASGQVAREAGTNYGYHSGVTSGHWPVSWDGENRYFRSFVDEYSVQNLARTNPDGTATVFNYYRIHACKPSDSSCMSTADYDRLRTQNTSKKLYDRMNGESFRHTILINTGFTSVTPTLSGSKYSWTDGGIPVEYYTFVPGFSSEVLNLTNLVGSCSTPYLFCGYMQPSEKFGFQIRIRKETANAKTLYPLLGVLHTGDAADSYTNITTSSTQSVEAVQGAMVENATDRVVFLASAEPKTTTFTSSTTWPLVWDPLRFDKAKEFHRFTVGSTASFTTDDSKNIEVFIVGLDPSKNWTVTRNSVSAGCTVSAQGICRFTIPGASQTHTVTWSASGNLTCNDACGICSGETACNNSSLDCYWHDNNGETTSQCFDYPEPDIADDCDDACGLCANQGACEASTQTCYWHDNNGATSDQCNTFPEPVITTCNDFCSVCADSTECAGSDLTCYWHDNDGGSPDQCNDTQERSVVCAAGNPSFCDNQGFCEGAGFCWEDSKCISTCTPPPTYLTVNLTPSKDVYLDEEAPTTNRDTAGLKIKSSAGEAGGALDVDATTFTIGGANSGTLGATTTRMTHTALNDNHTAYAYKDYTAGYFGDFNLTFTARSNTQQSASLVGYLCLSNTAAATMGGMNTADDGICFGFKRQSGSGWFLRKYDSGTSEALVSGAAFETRYVTLSRSGSTCTAEVYTNAGRTSHASGSPMQVTCGDSAKRYMYLAASGGTDGWAASAGTGYIEDVKITGIGDASGTDFVSLMQFDLSGIPANSSIVSAVLRGKASASTGSSGVVHLFKGERDFTEAEATWNVYSTGNNWGAAGARASSDYTGNYTDGTGSLGNYSVTGSESSGTTVQFSSSTALRDLIATNAGGSVTFVLQGKFAESAPTLTLFDSENATSGNRPILEINYNPPQSPPVVPQPGRRKRIMSGIFSGRF